MITALFANACAAYPGLNGQCYFRNIMRALSTGIPMKKILPGSVLILILNLISLEAR